MTLITQTNRPTSTPTTHGIPTPAETHQSLESHILRELDGYAYHLGMGYLLDEKEIEVISAGCKKELEGAAALPNKERVNKKSAEIAALVENAKRRLQFERAISQYEDTPANVIKVIQSSKYASALLKKAMQVQATIEESPTISIAFNNTVLFGLCNNPSGVIEINESLPFKEKVRTFLYELTNIINMEKFYEATDDVENCVITDEETFGQRIEAIEYSNTKQVTEVMEKCICEEGWDPKMDEFGPYLKKEWPTFELYYDWQKKHGHTDIYFQQFRDLRESLRPVI